MTGLEAQMSSSVRARRYLAEVVRTDARTPASAISDEVRDRLMREGAGWSEYTMSKEALAK